MIHRTSDKHAVGELRHLKGDDRKKMAFITDRPIIGEESPDNIRNVSRRENISDVNVLCGGDDEIDAGVVAGDVDVAVGISFQAAGEGGKVRESLRQGVLDLRDESREGERRAGEEVAFLDVMAGEHREVGDGELQIRHGRSLGRVDCGFGDDHHGG